jgi:hypothetical protein
MKSQSSIGLATALLVLSMAGQTLSAGAEDKELAVTPAGTWKVTISSTNTQARPTAQTLKLKLDGGVLTGTLSYNSGPVVNGKAPTAELPITEAKIQGREISFNFTHPPAVGEGPNANYSYRGRISGETIQGTYTMEWMGQTRTKGWEARRIKE